MQNYRDKFGNEGYGAYGQGNFIQTLPQPQRVTYGDFSGGLNTKDSREDTQPNSSPNALDVEVTLRDRLRPVPGTTTVETLARTANQLVLHASLDYTSELVMFDAPFIGVKTGNVTTWTDAGLPEADRRFAFVNFGGTLLFSNGRVGMYAKEAGKSEVKLVEKGPAAHTFASFAGRVFAGASIIGGNREPLGISWSGASSDHEEWETFDEDGVLTGAGFELLIDDMAQGNYIVALRTMGLDFLAIVLRNSIWIGRRTNQRARPADFQPRVSGVGAVNEASCVVTRFGVIHLHDSGVYIFDGNNSTLISEQINSELLPLDKSQLSLYSASYNPTSKQVFLFTPTCTWVYDLEHQRWHKRSLVATGASLFAPHIAAITWTELTGTWTDKDETWEDFKAKETDLPSYLFLGPTGTQLANEDPTSSSNFGNPMEPYWETAQPFAVSHNNLITTKQIVVNYEGEGLLRFDLRNSYGELQSVRELRLRRTVDTSVDTCYMEHTGNVAGMRVTFLSGKPEVLGLEQVILLRGPRLKKAPIAVLNLIDTGITVSGFFTDFSDSTVNNLPNGWALSWITTGSQALVLSSGGLKYLKFHGATDGQDTALVWTAIGQSADTETLIRARAVGAGSVTDFGPVNRCTNVVNAESGYSGRLRRFAGAALQLEFRSGISGLTVIGTAPFVPTVNTWYWVRLRSSGNNHYLKVWVDGSPEPSLWTLQGINSEKPAAAFAGVFTASVSGSDYIEVSQVGIDTLGGTAPSAPAVNGWILQPGSYNFRLIGIPTGYSVRAGGVTVAEIGGAANFALVGSPSTLELIDTTGLVVATKLGPIPENKQLEVDLYYE